MPTITVHQIGKPGPNQLEPNTCPTTAISNCLCPSISFSIRSPRCYLPCAYQSRCQLLKSFDHVIFIFFLMEMLIKMIAMGISNAPQAYLADYWNRLDFFIVIAGGLEYTLDIGNVNLSAIRTVRVLRPLRAINRIPSKLPDSQHIIQAICAVLRNVHHSYGLLCSISIYSNIYLFSTNFNAIQI